MGKKLTLIPGTATSKKCLLKYQPLQSCRQIYDPSGKQEEAFTYLDEARLVIV